MKISVMPCSLVVNGWSGEACCLYHWSKRQKEILSSEALENLQKVTQCDISDDSNLQHKNMLRIITKAPSECGLKYLHHSPASNKRRRKEIPCLEL
jgi:hypothetical protein